MRGMRPEESVTQEATAGMREVLLALVHGPDREKHRIG